MEGSCAKDFGKEHGMIHEGIITLRRLGLSADGWQRMTTNKELAQKVVELIEGQKEIWLEKILARERVCHIAFFGQEFDLTDFASTLKKYGESRIRFFQKLGLEPAFLPKVSMMAGDEYPGWKVKPEQWFYEMQIEGKIFRNDNDNLRKVVAVELPGVSVLIDTRLKPAYSGGKQMYKNDNLLGPIIGQSRETGKIFKYEYGPQNSRFGVSTNEWETQVKSALRKTLKVKSVILEPTIVANVIPQLYPYMPRKNDGNTNTWVWYEEYFQARDRRLYGGHSYLGGLANVIYAASDDHWFSKSIRPLAVL